MPDTYPLIVEREKSIELCSAVSYCGILPSCVRTLLMAIDRDHCCSRLASAFTERNAYVGRIEQLKYQQFRYCIIDNPGTTELCTELLMFDNYVQVHSSGGINSALQH